jgi:hypothetical protein
MAKICEVEAIGRVSELIIGDDCRESTDAHHVDQGEVTIVLGKRDLSRQRRPDRRLVNHRRDPI